MPSFKESFGLVYAEALSQGLPVIYTKNEGFDGNFDDAYVGCSVNPHSIEDIMKKCETVILNYNEIRKNCITASKKFKWADISNRYFNIYKGIV